jgi:dsRNA-specific ribonuclease
MPKNRIQVKPLKDLEAILGYKFKNQDLLLQAVTHASATSEKHPLASAHNQSSLAFVGDFAMKYAVARYLILNGREEVVGNRDALHKGTQTVIPNIILANIAREKLHLEEYIIRGNGHEVVSMKMYADCLEGIVGAIALDCGINQQEIIFSVIEKLCSDRYVNLLKPMETSRFKSRHDDDDDEELVCVTRSLWDHFQRQAGLLKPTVLLVESQKTRLQKFGLMVLWFFAICGIYFILREIIRFIMLQSSFASKTRRDEF